MWTERRTFSRATQTVVSLSKVESFEKRTKAMMGKIKEVTRREATTVIAVGAVLVPQQARGRFASTSPRAGFPSTPFVSNEDPFDPIDSNAYMMFRVAMGRNQQIVSDDLLMKLNQIGTATVGSSVASTSHLVDEGPVG